MSATSKDAVAKLVKAWESKNAQRALRGSGLGLMAVTLAACGGSDDSSTSTPTTPVTPPVTPVSASLTIGSDAITGTSANDTISGARVDGIQTWNSADSIAAGAGTDTLTAVITASVQPGAGAVTGVENITVTNANAAGAGLRVTFSTADDTFISGVSTVKNLGSTHGLTFARLTELATVSIENTAAATVVTFADSVLASATNTLNLAVNGATGTITIGSLTDDDGDYETLSIVASGAASSFAASGIDGDVTSLVISGAGDLSLTGASFENVGTVDASTATGAIAIELAADAVSGATNTKSITTGSGADTINIAAIDNATVGAVTVNAGAGNDVVNVGARLDSDYTITGGAGTDTLVITTAATAASSVGVTGFEALRTTASQDMTLFLNNQGFTTLRAVDGANISFTQVRDGVTTLQIDDDQAAATDTLALSRLIDAAANSLAIVAIDAVAKASITIDNEETVTISAADGLLSVGAVIGGATDFVAGDMTSLTVSGGNDVTLNDVSSTAIATVDLTGLNATVATGGSQTDEGDFVASFAASTVNMTVTANTSSSHLGTISVTTGSGADRVVGTVNGDTIVTGSGNDTITGGDGNDAITMGGGSDTLIFAASGTGNDLDTVTGLAGGASGDVLNFSAFLSGGSVAQNGGATTAITPFAVADTADFNITGRVVLLESDGGAGNATVVDVDEASEIAHLIDGAGDVFSISAGGKAIVISGDSASDAASGNDETAQVFFVHDMNGDGDVADANEVVEVMFTATDFDLDTLTTANFTFV